LKWIHPWAKGNATGAIPLEIAGGVAQQPEKLVSRDVELKRTRMKNSLHKEWIT
jgi:hypothetical protein